MFQLLRWCTLAWTRAVDQWGLCTQIGDEAREDVAKLVHHHSCCLHTDDSRYAFQELFLTCMPWKTGAKAISKSRRSGSRWQIQLAACRYNFFLAHSWGKDAVTHQKVQNLQACLKKHGAYEAFVDEDHLRAGEELKSQLINGISSSHVVLAFITEDCICKLANTSSMCYKELDAARAMNKLVFPIVLDTSMKDQRLWEGPLSESKDHVYLDWSSLNLMTDTDVLQAIIGLAKHDNLWRKASPQIDGGLMTQEMEQIVRKMDTGTLLTSFIRYC